MKASIFFKAAEHQQRFASAMQQLGKIYSGKLDQEYAAAVYILTADLDTWQQASDYVGRDGIDIPTLLQEIHFSGGYAVLIMLAGNLFNSQTHVDPVELMRLDDSNFMVALTALQVRRYSLHVDSFKA
jgi:hypothetical protein